MKIKSISLKDYRNYKTLDLPLSPGINILLGENAQGKTNVLESVYYSALSRSHRTNDDAELINQAADNASVRIEFERVGIDNAIDIRLSRQKPRQISLNSERIKVRELIGRINVVLFSPEDLFLIKGSPQGRRRFLDAEISQANPRYFSDLSVYVHLLNQRNNLLKKIREKRENPDMLAVWDPQLAELAARVVKKRLSSVEKLNALAQKMQQQLSGEKEKLEVCYQLHGAENQAVAEDLVLWYNKRLKESLEKDIIRGSTGVGPQRDDLLFRVNGYDLKAYGSQGQQRTGILALKLSELEFLHQESGEYPILLLDDVMSELDSGRRSELLNFIAREKIQTIITATEKAYFSADFLENACFVKEGKIYAEKQPAGAV